MSELSQDIIRTSFVFKLSLVLNDYKMAQQLEKASYDYAWQCCKDNKKEDGFFGAYFSSIYTGKMYEIHWALSPSSPDKALRDEINWAKLHDADMAALFEQIVERKTCDLCPAVSAKEKKMFEERKKSGIKEKYTTRYKCRKCKDEKCTYKEITTGCADEATKFRITCKSCGYEWISSQ